MPEKAAEMNARLMELLDQLGAEPMRLNPRYPEPLPNKEKVPAVIAHEQTGNRVVFTCQDNGAKLDRAFLVYTVAKANGEWFRVPATVLPGMKVSAQLPAGTTHYFINLVDENNFFVCYPAIVDNENPSRRSGIRVAEKALTALP